MGGRAWRVLDLISVEGSVGAKRGQIVIRPDEGEPTVISVADVAVLLLGPNVAMSPGAVHHLGSEDVAVLACDWRGVPYAGFYSWSAHTRVGARQAAQVSVTRPRVKNAWMRLIRAKILGQACTLASVDEFAAEHLVDLAKRVRSGDPNNLEAAAARWYWSRLFQGRAFARQQDGSDETNSLLNYGYGVLRGLGVRAVLGAGLAPAIGLFHHNRSNPFNLVEDLIEPFRPAVDMAVLRLPLGSDLDDPEVKAAMVASCTEPFQDDGLGAAALVSDLAQQLGRYLEGDEDRLTVPVWSNPVGGGVGESR